MKPVRRRFILFPESRLGFIAIPGILLAADMAIKNRFVLELVAAESPGKGVFGPDNLTADGETSRLQPILKFPLPGRRVTNVQRCAGLDDAAIGSEHSIQELLELLRAHTVALDLQTVLRMSFVVDVVGRIGENQVGVFAAE